MSRFPQVDYDTPFDHSLYNGLACAVTVRDVQTPLGGSVRPDEPLTLAWERIAERAKRNGYDPYDRVYLVSTPFECLGWLPFEFLEGDGLASDKMEPISPSRIISTNSTYHEAVAAFSSPNTQFWFVLERINGFSGSLHYRDLFNTPGRACLFALTLGLEEAAVSLCSHSSNWANCWNVIEPVSQNLARRHLKTRQSQQRRPIDPDEEPAQNLIRCTSFKDKCRMIRECRLIEEHTELNIEWLFGTAERIRNACAHPSLSEDLEGLIEGELLINFISELQMLTDDIRKATPKS